MNRSVVVFIFVALFTIAVFAVAASSLDSVTIESGFGIEGGSTSSDPGSGLESNGSQAKGSQANGSVGTGGGGFFDTTPSTDGTTDGDSGLLSPLLIMGAMIGIAGGGIALAFWVTGNTSPTRAETETRVAPSGDETETPNESPDPSNEVYRAWWEMVRQLDVTQYQSRSPAELASMAVQAGNDPETVAELTDLFRSVRYGDVSVTDDIEQRAAAARDRLIGEDVGS